MLSPAALARWTTSKVQNTVVAIPVTSVSGPPNLKVSRYVVSRHGTPRFFLMRSTTSPAVIRPASSTGRRRRYAGSALRGRTS